MIRKLPQKRTWSGGESARHLWKSLEHIISQSPDRVSIRNSLGSVLKSNSNCNPSERVMNVWMSFQVKRISNLISFNSGEVFLKRTSQVAFAVLMLSGRFNRTGVEVLRQSSAVTTEGCLDQTRTYISSNIDDLSYHSYKEIRDLCSRLSKPKTTDALWNSVISRSKIFAESPI